MSRIGCFLAALACATSAACGSNDRATGSSHDGGGGSGGALDAGDAASDAAAHFGDFQPWASPIDDYLAVGDQVQPGKYDSRINELAPFGDKLYFGYGDATFNLGESIAIEMRFFKSPDDPTADHAIVNGAGQGEVQTSPYQSGEEQIDRYRVYDGKLWQAGIDSIDADELWTQGRTTPKGIQGNVYVLDGDTFDKHRSINGGEHVHDIASWNGGMYMVGSGADTRTEFEAGQVFRYLWHSADLGLTFETVKRIMVAIPTQSDTRFVHLLPTSGKLYLFGYDDRYLTNQLTITNAAYDGQSVTDLSGTDDLAKMFPGGTQALPDGTGLVWGADVSNGSPHETMLHLAADGSTTRIQSFEGSTVLDVSIADTGELVYLVAAGDNYGSTPTSWDVTVSSADVSAPDTTTTLLHFTTTVEPVGIAKWKGDLFLGTSGGKVLRSVPTG